MSTDPSTVSAPPARPKTRPWLRFSLRTLLCFALFAGSVGLLVRNWAPWEVALELDSATVSPHKTRAFIYKGSDPAEMWDLEKCRKMCTVQIALGRPPLITPDWRYLIAQDKAKRWHIIDAVRGNTLATLNDVDEVEHHALWADSQRLLTRDANLTPKLYDIPSGKLIVALDFPRRINRVQRMKNGNIGITSYPNYFGVADPMTGKTLLCTQSDFIDPVFSKDERYAVVVHGKDLKLCDLKSNKIFPLDDCKNIANDLAGDLKFARFSDDGRILAIKRLGSEICIETATRTLTRESIALEPVPETTDNAPNTALQAITTMARNRKTKIVRASPASSPSYFRLDEKRLALSSIFDFELIDFNTGEVLAKRGSFFAVREQPPLTKAVSEFNFGAGVSSTDLPIQHSIQDNGNRVILVDVNYIDGNHLAVFRNLRPERCWGIAWLPEFWAAATLFALLIASLVRDRRTL